MNIQSMRDSDSKRNNCKGVNPQTSILMLVLFLFCHQSFAQTIEESEHVPSVLGAIMMANSHVPQAIEDEKTFYIIPTWGLDVRYLFSKHWSVALQGEIKLQTFEVEDRSKIILERSYPLALAGVLNYRFKRHWSFYVGPGYEFERSQNLFLVRFGAEYSFEISETFEIGLVFNYESKIDSYDTWTFGIAFNRMLWQKQRGFLPKGEK